MAAIVVKVIDGLIGHQVAVVEEKTVDSGAECQFKLVVDLPVVLCIDAQLVALHPGGRLCLTIVAVSETHHFWSSAVHKIFQRAIAVVACAVAHILVVGHLVLIAHARHYLVLTHVVSHVIFNIPHGVVHGIVPRKQLIAQRHVVARLRGVAKSVEDVDEGELG